MLYSYVEIFTKNIIIFYTFSEIRINRYLNNIYKMKCFQFLTSFYIRCFNPEIELIKDNKVLTTCKKKNITFNSDIMDFFIYTDIETYPMNKLIFNNLTSFTDNYELCSYKFPMIRITMDDKEYIITLHNYKETYYVANNKIDKYVIFYLLYKQHGINKNPDKTKYMMNLMDDNINIEILNENDLIILKKDNFTIQYRIKPIDVKIE